MAAVVLDDQLSTDDGTTQQELGSTVRKLRCCTGDWLCIHGTFQHGRADHCGTCCCICYYPVYSRGGLEKDDDEEEDEEDEDGQEDESEEEPAVMSRRQKRKSKKKQIRKNRNREKSRSSRSKGKSKT